MSDVFLKILNMSITAGWLILAVILVRLLLKKAPKWILCLLWGLVAIRLVCPFSFESVLSLIPSSETILANIAAQQEPSINSGIAIINKVINPVITESFAPAPLASANPLQIVIPIAAAVWIAGIVVLLAYALISFLTLKKTVSVCVPVGERILACDYVNAPFILGVFRPIIYVPSFMRGETLDHVIRHENAHLQRHDHWWKPLGFLLLAVYWFNPLCWIAYILLCWDIEMACDEKVIRDMDKDDMAAYSQALLDCNLPRKRIAACPLAFGEVGVKERVKGVLKYKKPAFWIILIAVVACIVLAVCLISDPFSSKTLPEKLGISMDMAVAEHYHSDHTEGHFAAVGYEVLKVSESANKITVYALVLYEEYSFDGDDVALESGAWGPAAITFDIASGGDGSSSYDVIEYWEPRGGSYYADDIRAKFPMSIRKKALDNSGSDVQHEKCLQTAREYYSVNQNVDHDSTDIFDAIYLGMTSAEVHALFGEPDYQASGLMWFGYNDVGTFDTGLGFEGTISRIVVGGKHWDVHKLINEAIINRHSVGTGAYLTESHLIMKFTAAQNGFTAEVQSVCGIYGRKGDYDVELKSSVALPIRITFVKNKNNDYELSSYHERRKGEDWGWKGDSAVESLQNNCYANAMHHFVGAIPSTGRYSIGVGTVAVTNVAERHTESGFFTIRYFPGATLQIEKYTDKWRAYAPQTWIIEYADKRKNITVGQNGSSVIPVTDDLIGIFNADENEYSIKFEKYTN